MPRELPAALNLEMVRAALAGRKVNTMRPMKPQPRDDFGQRFADAGSKIVRDPKTGAGGLLYVHTYRDGEPFLRDIKTSPLGVPGDHLYIRERARVIGYGCPSGEIEGPALRVEYAADGVRRYVPLPDRIKSPPLGHCLANGCYKEAARIWYEVVGVKAMPVSDITGAQIAAEGIDVTGMEPEGAVHDFAALWDSIYAKRGLGFNDGTWVWSYALRLLSTTGRPA